MSRRTIKAILMDRDGNSEERAEERIDEARDEAFKLVSEGRMSEAYDICQVHFNLEPDYLEELLW